VGNTYAFHLAAFHIIHDPVYHDAYLPFFPGLAGIGDSIFKSVKFCVEFGKDQVSCGHEVAQFEDFAGVCVEGLIAGGELRRAVQRTGGDLSAIGIVEILYGNIGSEVARYGIIPFVIEVINLFKVLFSIHLVDLLKQDYARV
jgi:hypothetical protein